MLRLNVSGLYGLGFEGLRVQSLGFVEFLKLWLYSSMS